jgi:hypothetical protein
MRYTKRHARPVILAIVWGGFLASPVHPQYPQLPTNLPPQAQQAISDAYSKLTPDQKTTVDRAAQQLSPEQREQLVQEFDRLPPGERKDLLAEARKELVLNCITTFMY